MNKGIALAIVILLAAAGAILIFSSENEKEQLGERSGTSNAIEFGMAGEYGYAAFSYNGSGNATLIALSEKPKSRIVVLKQDYLNTERYSYFMEGLRALEKKGFSISETEKIWEENNSVIILPSGAMPLGILERLDGLASSNEIIYIGKTDLVFSENLVRNEWLQNVSNFSRQHLVVVEKTLEEFYSERNFSLFSEIERNAWAEGNSETFEYEGSGNMTVFIRLNGARWLRMLPLADSEELMQPSAEITGAREIFPWERLQITVQMNYSNGTAMLSAENDGVKTYEMELDRVRGDKAFFLTLSFPSSGDYLLRVYDDSGTMDAARVHVKSLNISFLNSYGNAYEFSALLDGKPLENSEIEIGLNHSANTVPGEVKNGKIVVRADLRPGENVFVFSLFGRKHYVAYENNQEGLLAFYAKYLSLGLAAVACAYAVARMSRRPTYRIIVPEAAVHSNVEIAARPSDIIAAINGVEQRYGWKSVPLYAKEIASGLKKLSGGMDVAEGNVESIMKRLEEKGLVKSHMGLYSLSSWGDSRKNALRRMVRDKLIQAGMEFRESATGFSCSNIEVIFELADAKKQSIAVFGDNEEIGKAMDALDARKRAKIELMMKNGVLKVAAVDALDELL